MTSIVDKFTSVFLIMLSIFLWVSLSDVPPNIAYYPKVLVFSLFAFSLILLIQLFLPRKVLDTSSPECAGFACGRPMLELVGLSIIYILVLPYLGFICSSLVFLVVLMWRLGVRRWLPLAGVSIATVVFVYLAFEEGLMVPLPDGYAIWSLFN